MRLTCYYLFALLMRTFLYLQEDAFVGLSLFLFYVSCTQCLIQFVVIILLGGFVYIFYKVMTGRSLVVCSVVNF